MNFVRSILLALAFLNVGACANMSDVRSDFSSGKGVSRTFNVDLESVMRAAQRAAHERGADFVELNAQELTVSASFPASGIATASYVGVWFSPLSPRSTAVTVVSRRHRALSLVARVTEDDFLSALGKELFK